MAKRWKYIRTTLASVGYTTIASAANIDITSIDANGYVYYTDENGDAVKATYNSTTPINVGDDYIVFTQATIWLAGTSAYTSTFRVNNDNGVDVTLGAYTTYTGLNTNFATRSTNTLTAVASGTTTLTATTNSTLTASTSIIVGQFNTILNPTSPTLQVTANTAYALTGASVTNQFGTSVTRTSAKLYYSIDSGAGAIINANTTKTWTATGSSTLVIYDYNAKEFNATYTGATISVTIV